MKFLTICEGGVVRSVCCATQLKLRGQDAVAASWRFNSPETLSMLMEWADYIVLMQPDMHSRLPQAKHFNKHKFRILNVGEDIWGDSFHPDLREMVEPVLDEWRRLEWNVPPEAVWPVLG